MSLKYEQRAVVLLDVLGFKDLVWRSEGPEAGRAAVTLAAFARRIEDNKNNNKLRARAFSDSILITAAQRDLGRALKRAHELYCWLIQNAGVVSRGAATVGSLYETGDVVFGPALIEAYCLERSALYPRIILASKCDKKRVERDIELKHDPHTVFVSPLAPGSSSKEWRRIFRECAERGRASHPEGSREWDKYHWMLGQCE